MEANDKEKQRQEKILSDDSNRDNTYFPRAVTAAEGPVPSQLSSHLLSRQQQVLAV